jgi:hypothetical protein
MRPYPLLAIVLLSCGGSASGAYDTAAPHPGVDAGIPDGADKLGPPDLFPDAAPKQADPKQADPEPTSDFKRVRPPQPAQ